MESQQIGALDTSILTFVGVLPASSYFINDNDLFLVVNTIDDSVRTDADAVYLAAQFLDSHRPGIVRESINDRRYSWVVIVVHPVQLLFDSLAGDLNCVHCLWPFARQRIH